MASRLQQHIRPLAAGVLLMTLLPVAPASAQIVARESDVTSLRLGQRMYVDDGSCPAGQIKEIAGVKLTPNGIASSRKCVDRKTIRR